MLSSCSWAFLCIFGHKSYLEPGRNRIQLYICLPKTSTLWLSIGDFHKALNVVQATENYSKKPGFRSNKSRHCAYIIYSVKTRFFKRDMLQSFILNSVSMPCIDAPRYWLYFIVSTYFCIECLLCCKTISA